MIRTLAVITLAVFVVGCWLLFTRSCGDATVEFETYTP